MALVESPFTYLNEQAITAAPLNRDPYDFTFIENGIHADLKEAVLEDAPVIPDRGSYAVPSLPHGPHFRGVVKELTGLRFRRLVEQKFSTDLSRCPPVVLMMGNSTGHYNEGYAHPDSKHKIITVLVGFTRSWPYERGRLRVLRSADREDMAFEFAPEFGRILMFRVCDHSWHGFLPQKGQRMSLQLCFVDSEWYVKREYWRHRVSAAAKAVPLLRHAIDWAPRRFT